jgi:hypothetical protein
MVAGMASIEALESGSTRMKTVGVLQSGEIVKLDHVVWNDGLDSDAAGRIWFRDQTAALRSHGLEVACFLATLTIFAESGAILLSLARGRSTVQKSIRLSVRMPTSCWSATLLMTVLKGLFA